MAPPGKHVMSIFVQYAPYKLNGGWTDAKREAFGDAVIDTLERYAPNIRSIIRHRQVLTPADIERITGLSEGNIFQGELALHQLFFLRPAPAWAKYRTPVKGYWQCGAGTHPGRRHHGRVGSARGARDPGARSLTMTKTAGRDRHRRRLERPRRGYDVRQGGTPRARARGGGVDRWRRGGPSSSRPAFARRRSGSMRAGFRPP